MTYDPNEAIARDIVADERDRYKAALELLADPGNWSNASLIGAVFYGHDTPYELAHSALGVNGGLEPKATYAARRGERLLDSYQPHQIAHMLIECQDAHKVKPILPDAAHPDVLKAHYLAEIVCDHDSQMDNPVCACSLVNLGWHRSVGEAVDAWIEHVMEVARA